MSLPWLFSRGRLALFLCSWCRAERKSKPSPTSPLHRIRHSKNIAILRYAAILLASRLRVSKSCKTILWLIMRLAAGDTTIGIDDWLAIASCHYGTHSRLVYSHGALWGISSTRGTGLWHCSGYGWLGLILLLNLSTSPGACVCPEYAPLLGQWSAIHEGQNSDVYASQ